LCEREDLADIIQSNQKGASDQAAANQAVYEAISPSGERPGETMLATLENLEQMSKCKEGNSAFHVDFNLVGQAVVQADPILSADLPNSDHFDSHFPLDQANPNNLLHLIGAFVDEEKVKMGSVAADGGKSGSWLMLHPTHKVFKMKDPIAFQQAALEKINQQFNESTQGKSGSEIS